MSLVMRQAFPFKYHFQICKNRYVLAENEGKGDRKQGRQMKGLKVERRRRRSTAACHAPSVACRHRWQLWAIVRPSLISVCFCFFSLFWFEFEKKNTKWICFYHCQGLLLCVFLLIVVVCHYPSTVVVVCHCPSTVVVVQPLPVNLCF